MSFFVKRNPCPLFHYFGLSIKEETDRCHVISCRASRYFRISVRCPIIINVYTLFFSDTRWTKRQTISSGENIVSSITYLHKFNICRIIEVNRIFWVQVNFACLCRHTVHNDEISKDNFECCKFHRRSPCNSKNI